MRFFAVNCNKKFFQGSPIMFPDHGIGMFWATLLHHKPFIIRLRPSMPIDSLSTTSSSSSSSQRPRPTITMRKLNEPNLFDMIQCGKWKQLSRALRSKKAVEWIRTQKDDSNLTCLALALGYQAPIEIIERMIHLDPQLAYEKDNFGETALHVACLNGAPINLVNLLLERHEDIAYEVDHDNRVALHHAVEYSCEKEVSDDSTHETYVDVMQNLCDAAPDTLYNFDMSGETPIDLVQTMKTKYDISSPMYEKLQFIYLELTEKSIKYYRERKEKWELEGVMTNLDLGHESSEPTRDEGTSVSSFSTLQTPKSISTTSNCDLSRIG